MDDLLVAVDLVLPRLLLQAERAELLSGHHGIFAALGAQLDHLKLFALAAHLPAAH